MALITFLVRYLIILAFGHRDAVVHISGFSGSHVVPLQFVLLKIAKWFKYYVIYELRGGYVIGNYENASKRYQKLFIRSLNDADYVFYQGLENIHYFSSLSKQKKLLLS